ncbi:MAG: hypothetical protein M0Q21_02315 [Ignavibacteriaceae bacterium]|nr:hypothetical protein [Ignavibacteriaceae bacterium]
MFANTKHSFLGFALLFTVLTFSFFTGCEKKEAPKETVKMPAETTPQPAVEQPKVEEIKAVLDLKGTYTGTLDSRATTLKITEQTDSNSTFSGSITINYREVINQKISGKLDQEKMTVTMKDMLHSRYAGTYFAKLSEDGKKLSGTFTQTVDKTKSSFSLNKK